MTLHLPKGQTLAVVGESGSGKSTLARVITGLLPPLEGQVTFDGESLPSTLKARSKDQLRRIQMIYQMADTAMNPRQTVRDIIGRPLSFYFGLSGKEKTERVKELLDQIEMGARFLDRYPAELSGGQKQRVAIARRLPPSPISSCATNRPRRLIRWSPKAFSPTRQAAGRDRRLLSLHHPRHRHRPRHRRRRRRHVSRPPCPFRPQIQGPLAPLRRLHGPSAEIRAEMEIGWLERVLSKRRMESGGY